VGSKCEKNTYEINRILVNVQTLSAMLDVPKSTLYYWAKEGIIPYVPLGGKILFDPNDIEKCIGDLKKERDSAFSNNSRVKK
jgi:excisionase family DNA binding protein